jgi:hypothetical protein
MLLAPKEYFIPKPVRLLDENRREFQMKTVVDSYFSF